MNKKTPEGIDWSGSVGQKNKRGKCWGGEWEEEGNKQGEQCRERWDKPENL